MAFTGIPTPGSHTEGYESQSLGLAEASSHTHHLELSTDRSCKEISCSLRSHHRIWGQTLTAQSQVGRGESEVLMGSPPQSPGSQNDTQWTLIQWPLALGSQQSQAAWPGVSSFSSLRLSFHLCEMGAMRIVPWDGKDWRRDHGTKAENSTKNIALTATVRIPRPPSPSSGYQYFRSHS